MIKCWGPGQLDAAKSCFAHRLGIPHDLRWFLEIVQGLERSVQIIGQCQRKYFPSTFPSQFGRYVPNWGGWEAQVAYRMPREYRCLLYLQKVYGELRREVASHDLVGPGAMADLVMWFWLAEATTSQTSSKLGYTWFYSRIHE